MRYRRHKLTFLSLALATLFLGACLTDGGCPCGSDPSDPLSEHDLSFDGSHTVDGECVCQCGTDTPYGLSRDRECSEYEEACTDSRDVEQTLMCQ